MTKKKTKPTESAAPTLTLVAPVAKPAKAPRKSRAKPKADEGEPLDVKAAVVAAANIDPRNDITAAVDALPEPDAFDAAIPPPVVEQPKTEAKPNTLLTATTASSAHVYALQYAYDGAKRDGADENARKVAMSTLVDSWPAVVRRPAIKRALAHFDGPTINTPFYAHLKALFSAAPVASAQPATKGATKGTRTPRSGGINSGSVIRNVKSVNGEPVVYSFALPARFKGVAQVRITDDGTRIIVEAIADAKGGAA